MIVFLFAGEIPDFTINIQYSVQAPIPEPVVCLITETTHGSDKFHVNNYFVSYKIIIFVLKY